MKHLVESISSRKSGKYSYDFPKEPDLQEICRFLTANGFRTSNRSYSLSDDPSFRDEPGETFYLGEDAVGYQFLVFKDTIGNIYAIDDVGDKDYTFYVSDDGKHWVEILNFRDFSRIVKRNLENR